MTLADLALRPESVPNSNPLIDEDILARRLLDAAIANYEAALAADPSLSKVYARKLSELGFLPLSNAPSGVLTALRWCIYARKTACLVTS